MTSEILATIKDMQHHGHCIGLVNGCFDLLHPGHVFFLRHAKAYCDHLVVGLNSDDSVTRIKGPGRPYFDYGLRLLMLEEIESVGSIVEFDGDVGSLIEWVRPNVIIRGRDQTLTDAEKAIRQARPGEIVQIKAELRSCSTTEIEHRIVAAALARSAADSGAMPENLAAQSDEPKSGGGDRETEKATHGRSVGPGEAHDEKEPE